VTTRFGRGLLVAVIALFTAALLLVLSVVPAAAEVTLQDVETAREELRRVSARLEGRLAEYEAMVVEEVILREQLDLLVVDLTARERELLLARLAVRARVADMYMSAAIEAPAGALAVSHLSQIPARFAYLASVARTDREVVNRLERARRDFAAQQEAVSEAIAYQESLVEEMDRALDDIYADLEQTNAEYQAVKAEWDAQEAERLRREEEERRYREWLATSTTTTAPPETSAPPTTNPGDTTTTTSGGDSTTTTAGTTTTTVPPPPPNPGVRVCPVDGATTFRDSWGEPRPGGRAHTGTDMMSPVGTPLVAIEDGVIWSPNWHYAGGIGLYINGDSGDRWYYAHMQGYAPGIVDGVRVSAGQLVGYVGQTGNAASPHLHIGYLPGAAYYANPYPIVASVC